MSQFEEYAEAFKTIRMERNDGILEVTFHSRGGPLRWSGLPHREFPMAFRRIADDPDNRVVILTGTGDEFSGPVATPDQPMTVTAQQWDPIYQEGKDLLWNLLDIPVPVIAAVNGPAPRHAEIPLLSDIVLAAEHATFQDSAHYPNGVVPGDGVHVVYPLLLGLNRGRYFLLTGEVLDARTAHELGLVGEVLAPDELRPRARELAREIATRPPLVNRYTRVLFTQQIKRALHDVLGYGLALEGLAAVASTAATADT